MGGCGRNGRSWLGSQVGQRGHRQVDAEGDRAGGGGEKPVHLEPDGEEHEEEGRAAGLGTGQTGGLWRRRGGKAALDAGLGNARQVGRDEGGTEMTCRRSTGGGTVGRVGRR